nr:hypothetical protein [Tanacetum cinerariifolium]
MCFCGSIVNLIFFFKYEIFANEFFKHLDSRVFLPITVITCHGSNNVDDRVISEKVYGFNGPTIVSVFDHNSFEVTQLTNAFGDDRYDRVVDAATRQMVLVED